MKRGVTRWPDEAQASRKSRDSWKKNLLQSVRDAAYGRRATRTTKREFDKDGKLVKETVTEIPYAPDKEALKWLQERGLEEKPDGDP